ncbi:hypothetical protein J2Z70_000182 [Paenibacillus silagei]|uniref:Uncharacterized protein n=1 Tax=Paenibacillus silagei TaxID=1670801 RepID=A0ABS4NJ35_9BACL|nr:hypothetical protein [Paenibacillus silagei]
MPRAKNRIHCATAKATGSIVCEKLNTSAMRLRATTMYVVFRIHLAHEPVCHHNVCCFSHTFGPCACVPPQCMLFSAYIWPMRLRATTMYVVFRIHLAHAPTCHHNVCCFPHTFGPRACVPPQCMLFSAYIWPMRLRATTMYVVFNIHCVTTKVTGRLYAKNRTHCSLRRLPSDCPPSQPLLTNIIPHCLLSFSLSFFQSTMISPLSFILVGMCR